MPLRGLWDAIAGLALFAAVGLVFVLDVALPIDWRQAANNPEGDAANRGAVPPEEPPRNPTLLDTRKAPAPEPLRPSPPDDADRRVPPKAPDLALKPAEQPAKRPALEVPVLLGRRDTLEVDKLDYYKRGGPLPAVGEADKPSAVWDGHTNHVRGVVFDRDSKFVVSVSGDVYTVRDGKTGRPRAPDYTVRVWDARRGLEIHKLDGFQEPLDGISISPGGRLVVFGHSGHYGAEDGKWVNATDHDVRVWDLQEKREISLGQGRADGTAAGTEGGPPLRFRGLDSSVFSTHFSPSGELVAGAANNGTIALWRTETGARVYRGQVNCSPRPGGSRGVSCIKFSPDGRYFLTVNGDFTLSVWATATAGEVRRFESHKDVVWDAAVHQTKDGKWLVLSGSGGWQRIDGTGYDEGTPDYAIRLWDLTVPKSGRLLRQFHGHEKPVECLAFCPNDRHFLSGSSDSTVRLWDLTTGRQLRLLGRHTNGGVRSVAVAPDGRAAVSGGDDCKVRFWQLPATGADLVRAVAKKDRPALEKAGQDTDTMGPEDAAAFPELLPFLDHEDAAIGKLVGRALVGLSGLCEQYQLPAFGQWAPGNLVKVLRPTTSPEQRYVAAWVLGKIGPSAREAVGSLTALLRSEQDPGVLAKAAEALGRIGEKSAETTAALEQALRHRDPLVRKHAAAGLGRLGPAAVNLDLFLLLLAPGESAEVQAAAERALREKLPTLTAADLVSLRGGLRSNCPKACLYCAEAVAKLGGAAREALPDLQDALKSRDEEVCTGVIRALKALGPEAKPARSDLGRIVEEGDADRVRIEAVAALHAIDPDNELIVRKGIGLLLRALKPATKPEIEAALLEPLSQPAVRTLIAIGGPVVRPLFEQGLESWNPQKGKRRQNQDVAPTMARYLSYVVIRELVRKATDDKGLATALKPYEAALRNVWSADEKRLAKLAAVTPLQEYERQVYLKANEEARLALQAVTDLKVR